MRHSVSVSLIFAILAGNHGLVITSIILLEELTDYVNGSQYCMFSCSMSRFLVC